MAASLSREQVADALTQAGFTGQDLIHMVGIAGRESGYQPAAHRSDQPKSKLSGDLGLWQINYTNWPIIKSTLGLTSKDQLFDPVTNARAAKVLFDRSGLSPWAAGPGGFNAAGDPLYKVNVGAAQQAVQNYNANPQQYSVSNGMQGTSNGGASNNNGAAQTEDYQENGGGNANAGSNGAAAMSEEVQRTNAVADYAPPEVDPAQQNALTSLLEGFGIEYPDAPRATPQLLAFLRGLGMERESISDQFDLSRETLDETSNKARNDLQVSDQRRRSSIGNDAARRGALVSGATNTTYGRQAENYANTSMNIANAYARGMSTAETQRDTDTNKLNQQALESVLNEDTRQAEETSRNQATTAAIRASQQEADLAYQRQRAAEQARNDATVGRYQGA